MARLPTAKHLINHDTCLPEAEDHANWTCSGENMEQKKLDSFARIVPLTLDMSGGRKPAKPAFDLLLTGRAIRPLVHGSGPIREMSDPLPRTALTIASTPRPPTNTAAITAPSVVDCHAVSRMTMPTMRNTVPKIASAVRESFWSVIEAFCMCEYTGKARRLR